MNYGSFPEEVIENTEEIDHKNTGIEISEDNTMTETCIEKELNEEFDSSTLTSLESTPRAVGMPKTLKISPPGQFSRRWGDNNKAEDKNSDEELASQTAKAVKRQKDAVQKEPVNHLLLIVYKKRIPFAIGEAVEALHHFHNEE
ncbi:hypothetical protein BDD12DRAFT_904050 [Trichophaea hybrida]|nr:hypothetical protein BDD12DRAFT_904050 [Trichophaea hybrida]